MSQQPSWNFGRFLRTVTYFDTLPFLRFIPCLKTLVLGDESTVNDPVTPPIGTILLVNVTPELGKPLVNLLQQQHYPVRVYSPHIQPGQLGEGVDYVTGDLSAQAFQSAQTVIYCDTGEDFRGLLQATVHHLGTGETTTLFDFGQVTEDLRKSWGAVDDVVMGGVSESGIRLVEGKAVFAGNVSTANSGGFASVRNRNFDPPLDLSGYEGIELRVCGDGKRYKFIMRCEGRWDGVSYCYSFDTVAQEWITVRIPFRELIPVFRAKTLPDVGGFDPSCIYSLQLMLSKFEYDGGLNPTFEPGGFTLQLERIAAYGGEPTPKFIWVGEDEIEVTEKASLQTSSLPYGMVTGVSAETVGEQCLQVLERPVTG
ncbi:CIA30 family protein [Spirulina sp. CS-785/01]|uniref:CIA30 family protein n=1 Tax=Spirulina sp. CS-785/01 TaxID=3021716 RepID=UPI00232EF59B|nr:CIA30 family protein [Spirulina sp. CS-785/01]MDB9314585.1 CIA30 family protein [Spirulina sp. CS-785/01]